MQPLKRKEYEKFVKKTRRFLDLEFVITWDELVTGLHITCLPLIWSSVALLYYIHGFGICSSGVDCAVVAVIIQMLTDYVPPFRTGSVVTKYQNAFPSVFNALENQMCKQFLWSIFLSSTMSSANGLTAITLTLKMRRKNEKILTEFLCSVSNKDNLQN